VFLLIECDNQWWIQNFRITKETLFNIANKLKPLITQKDIMYKFAIHVEVRVACVIHKLFHGLNMLTCNELFVIGTSITGLVTCEVVRAMNIMFKSLIAWPMGPKMEDVMLEFKELCGLPSMQGVINYRHISISKPKFDFDEDYYFHKIGGYSIVAQVVDVRKKFIDIYVGLLKSVNNFQVLQKSSL
jgi:hypothetical protein